MTTDTPLSSPTGTPHSTDLSDGPHPVYVEQAKALCHGGELLPGGTEALAKKLQQSVQTQTPLRVKLGLDPTRPDLHLGHSVVLKKLRAFQDLGHQAVLIIGDATALIGDPSGRNQTRPPLSEADIQVNAQTYLDQASKIIDVTKAEIVHNSKWFLDFALPDFLRLTSQMTVAQMLVRDDFSKRYAENTPISLHEFIYPLMQAYDSVMVRSDLELGGTDQRFNNLLGREIQAAWARQFGAKTPQQLVLLMPLLEGTDGVVKMSKSYPAHCINLTDTPNEMFGKMMSIPDTLLARYQGLLTPMTVEQIEQSTEAMQRGDLNPRDVKAALAKWLVAQYHSPALGDDAERNFVEQFRNKGIPDTLPEVTLSANEAHPLVELLLREGLVPSKAEAKRLVEGGGLRLDQEKVSDPAMVVMKSAGESVVIQVGKRKFLKAVFE